MTFTGTPSSSDILGAIAVATMVEGSFPAGQGIMTITGFFGHLAWVGVAATILKVIVIMTVRKIAKRLLSMGDLLSVPNVPCVVYSNENQS
jgi:hypothetical protein